jgi:hypothetical protein
MQLVEMGEVRLTVEEGDRITWESPIQVNYLKKLFAHLMHHVYV